MLNSDSNQHGTQYTQKPEGIRNKTANDSTTTTAKSAATQEEKKSTTSINNLEIITEESVIQYLNEILSVYLNELSSPPTTPVPPTTPYDNETFFFEKPVVTRKDSKIFDIHYSNEGRQRRRQKSLKVEPLSSRIHDNVKSSQGKRDTTIDSGNVKIDKNLSKSGHHTDYFRKDVSIDCVNEEKYHSTPIPSSQIDTSRTHIEKNTKYGTPKTEEKTLRKVCSIPLDNINAKFDNGQANRIDKVNNINNKNDRLQQNELSGKATIFNDKQQQHVSKRKVSPSISAPPVNNHNKGRAKSMIIDNERRINEQYSGRSANRSTRTRSVSSREKPNKELFTVSLYKTTTTSPPKTLGKKEEENASTPENTKLVCTMYMS